MDHQTARLERLERRVALIEAHLSRGFWRAIDATYEHWLPQRRLQCIVCSHSAEWGEWEKLTATCMFGGGKLERYRCPKCDCIFGPQKYLDLDDDFVSRDYQLLYTSYSEADSFDAEIYTFDLLAPTCGGLYLNWGCGGAWSRTVAELRKAGYDVWGYEPSAETNSEFVVNRRGAISARFEGIFSNNVIEHFREPVRQFEDFKPVLADSGKMAHSSPCYDYAFENTRFHTVFLLGRSPHVLAERTGFRVNSIHTAGQMKTVVFEHA